LERGDDSVATLDIDTVKYQFLVSGIELWLKLGAGV
jgi:hypothetical protein